MDWLLQFGGKEGIYTVSHYYILYNINVLLRFKMYEVLLDKKQALLRLSSASCKRNVFSKSGSV